MGDDNAAIPPPSPPPRDLKLDLEMMYNFKAANCPPIFLYVSPHHPDHCPYIHPGTTYRRNVQVCDYSPEICPSIPKCDARDHCKFAHNIYEHCLHPSKFRNTRCCRGLACRTYPCLFPHNQNELFFKTKNYAYESPPRTYRSASPRAVKELPPYPLLNEMERLRPVPFQPQESLIGSKRKRQGDDEAETSSKQRRL
ncbi:hypothetical protein LIER_40466 [Lithospermum erythrorhizon]|uniref:C3H1-type domain-containing protein n=1 Tax=Lithospermum erythrorhizon TaxID=34254 RepID=A0AAV3QYQ0_LITER